MPTSLLAAAMGLAELLQYFDQYLVPEYQRVYGWGEREITRLFSDIEQAMRPGAPRFFLGTIYLAAQAGSRTAQIADGQQRMLTALIAYAVARDLAGDEARARRLHSLIAAPNGPESRLIPRDRDAEFLRKWVHEPGATLKPFAPDATEEGAEESIDDPEASLSESQYNIIANRDAIAKTLKDLGEDGRKRLFDFLETEARVVVITAPTLEDARNAYASTQTRGLRQAEADKIKVELIGDCPVNLRSRLASQWEECEAVLGKEDLTELLQYMIVIRGERKPLHAIEVDLLRAFDLPEAVEAFIERELAPSAQAYRQLCGGLPAGGKPAKRINGHLITLLRTSHDAWKAPALLALRELSQDPPALEAFLGGLERLAAAMMIGGTDPNRMLDRYIAVIRDLKKNPPGRNSALELSQAERSAARRRLGEMRFATRERFRTALLLKLNDILAGDVQAIDPKTISCEHILPRNAPSGSQWRQDFRSRDGRRYEGARYVHTLGNLAILLHADNQEADTQPFTRKRPILKRSKFALAHDAAKSKAWTSDVVSARTERFAGLLADYWRF